eukprot:TRINITY_DN5497_c0_g1_i1.p1 TRINITY_DN5497_c0_g1~~TRINITY_DN5497_c0_g1_i1.p1  ORF type:complete len:379 (+),score=109.07 TRINITY_DN5497_c0_g1_i1:222-1358(+)
MKKKNTQNNNQQALKYPFGIKAASKLIPKEILKDEFLEQSLSEKNQLMILRYVFDEEVFKRVLETNNYNLVKKKALRRAIQISTVNTCLFGKYFKKNEKGEIESVSINKEELMKAPKNSKMITENQINLNSNHNHPKNKQTKVLVIEGDCVETSIWLSKQNKSVCLLNNASTTNEGGGWRKGSSSQEEYLHRVSNMFQCLEDPYKVQQRSWSYPLPTVGGLYSPDVLFFRNGEEKGYSFLDKPEKISVLSVCGVKSPSISENKSGGFSIDTLSRKLLEKKIRAIFDICLQNKNDCLVVSAFSCGVYGCPPDVVSSIFREVYSQYDGCLDHLVFSLIEDTNSFKDHNPEGNVKPFSKTFKIPVQKIVNGELVVKEDEGN